MKETDNMEVEEVKVAIGDKVNELEKELAYMKGKMESYDKQFAHIDESVEANKKDIKTLSSIHAMSALLGVVVTAALAFCIFTQNNTLKQYAEAINNNSYSIESIITSIKGGPATND